MLGLVANPVKLDCRATWRDQGYLVNGVIFPEAEDPVISLAFVEYVLYGRYKIKIFPNIYFSPYNNIENASITELTL